MRALTFGLSIVPLLTTRLYDAPLVKSKKPPLTTTNAVPPKLDNHCVGVKRPVFKAVRKDKVVSARSNTKVYAFDGVAASYTAADFGKPSESVAFLVQFAGGLMSESVVVVPPPVLGGITGVGVGVFLQAMARRKSVQRIS